MDLQYRMPTRVLLNAVSIVGQVSGLGGAVSDVVPALLPNLHIRLRGSSRYKFGAGPWLAAPSVALIGPTSAAFRVEMSADFEMACVGLLPEGWRACVGLPCGDLADAMIDAATVWPASAIASLLDACIAARGFAERQAIVESFLLGAVRSRPDRDAGRIGAIRQWLECPGAISLDALPGHVGLCPRQVARLTLSAYGASPKTLAMKYRALRAAGALTVRGRAGLADATDSYADQSHLIRDFHRFIGWTPGRFLAERQPLARATMLGRYNAGARSYLVLCS
jgi:AraC-like DNA-binding protein